MPVVKLVNEAYGWRGAPTGKQEDWIATNPKMAKIPLLFGAASRRVRRAGRCRVGPMAWALLSPATRPEACCGSSLSQNESMSPSGGPQGPPAIFAPALRRHQIEMPVNLNVDHET
jgi:hypothetical protein